MQPLFWNTTPTSVRISPSIDALLAAGVPAELDDAAMAVFLRIGFFVGDDTPFAAIRALPAAGEVSWTPDRGAATDGAWRIPAPVRHLASGGSRPVRGLFYRRDRARAAPGDRALSSSRSAAATTRVTSFWRCTGSAACRITASPCIRILRPRPTKWRVATTVAAALGVRHVLLQQREHRVAAEREKNVLTHYCSDEHVQFMPLRDYFSRRPFEVFDGLAGDVLSQSQRLDASLHRDFVDGRFEPAAERILGDAQSIEPALARLLTRRAAARFNRRLAVSRLAGEIARHADAPNPIAGFFFFSRMRREVALAPYGVLDVCPVSTPFLDAELVDLMLSLPFAVVADRTLHTETLHRRYPAWAHLPFDGKRKGREDTRGVRRSAAALLALALRSRSALIDTAAIAARAARTLVSGVSAPCLVSASNGSAA